MMLIFVISGILVRIRVDIQIRTIPNEGIWNSLRNMFLAFGICLICALFLYAVISSILPVFLTERDIKVILLNIVSFPVVIAFQVCGGLAVIQHFSLRLILYYSKLIPWDFVKFFRQAEDRLFIQRTGGSYIFIHRYLQEHFASLAPKG
jgi:hypothetical protein